MVSRAPLHQLLGLAIEIAAFTWVNECISPCITYSIALPASSFQDV